ncbi:MAG TPA: four helix bundle protein [Burkholderiales bacterium]|nr:four helix bundle protein [Burkholderiales bacterium]
MADSPIRRKSFAFALKIIRLSNSLRQLREYVISNQLVRAGTSIGSNVEEAQAGQSRRDFLSKMAVASKEARETKYWLRLIDEGRIGDLDVGSELADVDELIRILTSIVKTTGRSK